MKAGLLSTCGGVDIFELRSSACVGAAVLLQTSPCGYCEGTDLGGLSVFLELLLSLDQHHLVDTTPPVN